MMLQSAVVAMALLGLGMPAVAQAACAIKPGETLLTADLDKGRRAFLKCRACHTLKEGERNLVGPNLWRVMSRGALGAGGFSYSQAFTTAAPRWSLATLDRFVEKPAKMVPGTKMVFAGIADPQERANLLAWLARETGTPLPGCP